MSGRTDAGSWGLGQLMNIEPPSSINDAPVRYDAAISVGPLEKKPAAIEGRRGTRRDE